MLTKNFIIERINLTAMKSCLVRRCNSRHTYFIFLHKIAPVAVGFAAALGKFQVLYFGISGFGLFFHQVNRLPVHHYHFFHKLNLLLVLFNKINFAAHHVPALAVIIVEQYFVENNLPPVITAIRLFGIRSP